MVQTNPYLDRYRKAEGEAISGSLIINHRVGMNLNFGLVLIRSQSVSDLGPVYILSLEPFVQWKQAS